MGSGISVVLGRMTLSKYVQEFWIVEVDSQVNQ